MQQIRVIGIAPYKGMQNLMEEIVGEYPEISLTTYVGDLNEGLQILNKNYLGNYDVVISRGRTAQMLRANVAAPVVDVEVSMYDILCAVKLADADVKKTAVVSFLDISEIISQLCELTNVKVDIIPVPTREHVEEAVRDCKDKGYESVICDMVAYQEALKLGMNAFLVTSGPKSIRDAFEKAIQIQKDMKKLKNQNRVLTHLLVGHSESTVLFDVKGNIVFASDEFDQNGRIEDILKGMFSEAFESDIHRTIKDVDGQYIEYRSNRITIGEDEYIAFYYGGRGSSLPGGTAGIELVTRQESETLFLNSMLCYSGVVSRLNLPVAKAVSSPSPIFIFGQPGTGTEDLAFYYYSRMDEGRFSSSAYIIDFRTLDNDGKKALFSSSDSPLYCKKGVLIIKNFEDLGKSEGNEAINLFLSLDVCRNNKVFFCCSKDRYGNKSRLEGTLVDKTNGISVFLPSLEEQKSMIPTLFNQTLSVLNSENLNKKAGATPSALRILENFSWPYNYNQFRRVLSYLVMNSSGLMINERDVEEALDKEKESMDDSPVRTIPYSIPLNKTLREIECDIAKNVLEEYDGNKTVAAKCLGISRTTLWRIVGEGQDGES